MPTPLQGTASAANAIQRVHYTHDAMIEVILANPGISQNELAAYFSMTVGWTSRVINSDAFQARLAERKDEVVDPLIRQNFEERLKGLANQSLDVISRKLDATQSADLATKTLELTTKALGMGARDRSAPVGNVTFVVALPAKINDQNEWVAAAKPQPVVVDVPSREVTNG